MLCFNIVVARFLINSNSFESIHEREVVTVVYKGFLQVFKICLTFYHQHFKGQFFVPFAAQTSPRHENFSPHRYHEENFSSTRGSRNGSSPIKASGLLVHCGKAQDRFGAHALRQPPRTVRIQPVLLLSG